MVLVPRVVAGPVGDEGLGPGETRYIQGSDRLTGPLQQVMIYIHMIHIHK